MPPRLTPLTTGHTYHVFNRTIDSKPIFKNKPLSELLIELLIYYRSLNVSLSYSRFKALVNKRRQQQILNDISVKRYFKISMLAYCFMPNHFHFLIQQKTDGAISKYMSDVFNALTRHFNLRNNRKGPLLLPRFQAKRIVSREQLIHVSRYIHLNPFSADLIQDIRDLNSYMFSSYPVYSGGMSDKLCDSKRVLAEFGNSRKLYINFVLSNAEYQRTLEYTKYAQKW